jgi:hypothetical protein
MQNPLCTSVTSGEGFSAAPASQPILAQPQGETRGETTRLIVRIGPSCAGNSDRVVWCRRMEPSGRSENRKCPSG